MKALLCDLISALPTERHEPLRRYQVDWTQRLPDRLRMLRRRKRLRLKTGRDLAHHAGLHLPVEFFLSFPLFTMLSQVSITGSTKSKCGRTRRQSLSYDIRSFLWFCLDVNFWYGGTTSLSGVANPDTRLTNSRVGVTGSSPWPNIRPSRSVLTMVLIFALAGTTKMCPSRGSIPGSVNQNRSSKVRL